MISNSMKRLTFAAAALLTTFTGLSAYADSGVTIPVNRSELITSPADISDVLVADPAIADVVVHGSKKISVLGKKIGQTSIRIFDKDSNVVQEVLVNVSYDLPAIRKTLKELFPDEQVGVKVVNTNLAVVGNVSNAQNSTRILRVVREYINREQGAGQSQAVGEANSNGGSGGQDILNLMTIASNQQVMLRVRVGEVQRNTLRKLGVDLAALRNAGNFAFAVGSGSGVGSVTGAGASVLPISVNPENAFGVLGGGVVDNNGDGIGAALEALETNGLFKVLAEPNLVAVSGEKAEFLAGGEFPIPIAQGSGGTTANNTITIEYRSFGVAVQFTPLVLSENRIRLAVQPEVSELTNAGSVTISGFNIPGLSTRRAKTTIELAPGESFMIAGLIKDTFSTNVNQVPGVGEVPILSSFFRKTSTERDETELVMAVTPYLVDPVASSDIKLPTDDFRPASAMETFFYGALGSLGHDELRISQKPALEGPIGFMVD